MTSEAHENTRIRQLTDAAAHWEHKYTNARQYNRNLEERCQKLEAHLRKADRIEGDIGVEQWYAERDALLGLTSETVTKP